MELYIKYFAIIFCGIYTYKKLLNLVFPLKCTYVDVIFTSLLSLIVYCLRVYIEPLSMPAIIIIFTIYIIIATKTQLELAITTTILSFGFSFAMSVISAVVNSAVFDLFGFEHFAVADISLAVSTGLIQFLLSILPFRLRRLRNGMPFLIKKGASSTGVLISVILLSCVIVLSNYKNGLNFIYVIATVFILISAVFILFWWRSRLTKTYLERLRAEEVQRLEDTIEEKEEQIRQLELHNEALAKIIHKDNKLIPAMELAVEEYLQFSERTEDDFLRKKGQLLLEQLQAMSGERTGILAAYQAGSKKLPVTGIAAVDALMSYMFNKARENGVDLELTLSGSVKYMTENVVSVADLATLLADLTENAIIATHYSDRKKILVLIGITERYYMVSVLDSGIPFEADTLANMGLRKSTTHADSGGSGIGLMSTFEILNRYKASLTLEEYPENDGIYTKRLSILFDDKNQILIQTDREEEIKGLAHRDNLLIEKSFRMAK